MSNTVPEVPQQETNLRDRGYGNQKGGPHQLIATDDATHNTDKG